MTLVRLAVDFSQPVTAAWLVSGRGLTSHPDPTAGNLNLVAAL